MTGREDLIEEARDDLDIEIIDDGCTYGRIFACHGQPRCEHYGTGIVCPWCTKIIVRPDGGEIRIEPGNA